MIGDPLVRSQAAWCRKLSDCIAFRRQRRGSRLEAREAARASDLKPLAEASSRASTLLIQILRIGRGKVQQETTQLLRHRLEVRQTFR